MGGGVDEAAVEVEGEVFVGDGDEGKGVDGLVEVGEEAAGEGEGGVGWPRGWYWRWLPCMAGAPRSNP